MAVNNRALQAGRILPTLLLAFIAIAALAFFTADNETPTTPVATDTRDTGSEIVAPITPPAPQDTAERQGDSESPGSETSTELAFLDEAFTTLSRWQAENVRPLLAPATAQAVDDEQLRNVLGVLQARLGGLVSYESPRVTELPTPASVGVATDSLRSYGFMAHYTEGEAQVNLVLQTLDDGVSLYNFDIQAGDTHSMVRRD